MPTNVFLALLCVLLLTACDGQTTVPPPQPSPTIPTSAAAPATAAPTSGPAVPADWTRSWLRSEPCAPPCFLGITPGTSSPTEARALMAAAFPAVEPLERESFRGDDMMLNWFWKVQDQRYSATTYFYTQPSQVFTTPVDTIVALTVEQDALPFSAVLTAFGEPDFMLANTFEFDQSGLHSTLDAVYLDRGMMLSFQLGTGTSLPDVAPEMPLFQVLFFAPTREGFDVGAGSYYDVSDLAARLVPWQGFLPYTAYCGEPRPTSTQQRCGVTPSAPAVDWQRAWLRDDACASPCFLGITPGTTTPTELLALMGAAYPAVTPTARRITESAPSALSWRWEGLRTASELTAYFYEVPPQFSVAPVDTVISVVAAVPQMAALHEATAVFGEPSHVLAVAHKDPQDNKVVYLLAVVYRDRGLMLVLNANQGDAQADLTPEMLIGKVAFFAPTLEGFDAGVSAFYPVRQPSALLVPWQGFQPFAAYCRSSQPDTQAERCP